MSGRLATQVAPQPACLSIDAMIAQRITGGKWIGSQQTVDIYGAVIDSRAVTTGCLFACITGARHDGHDFAETAVGDGAVLILANRLLQLPVPILLVDDVTVALGALAREFRERYGTTCTWIGIGGANGKTTTKALIAAACEADAPGKVHATRGNMNNELGVPLTILATPPDMRYVVVELGANHPGEIAALARIAQPDIGVLVSIGPEHLEGFGDLAGVTKAECELFESLPKNAPAFIGMFGLAEQAEKHGSSENKLREIIKSAAIDCRLHEIGGDNENALPIKGQLENDGLTLSTSAGEARMHMLGLHNLANATLAFHAVVAAGANPQAVLTGLQKSAPVAGRLVPRRCGQHLLIDDTYNANPASMAAGLQVLNNYSGNKLAVLGFMGELGTASDQEHRDVGALVAQLELPLISVGENGKLIGAGYEQAQGKHWQHATDRMQAVGLIKTHLSSGPQTILFKASRSVGLDAVVQTLLDGGVV